MFEKISITVLYSFVKHDVGYVINDAKYGYKGLIGF